jgi:hypothetical protein
MMVALDGYMLTGENGRIIGSAQLLESTLVFYSLGRSIIITSHRTSLQMKYMR